MEDSNSSLEHFMFWMIEWSHNGNAWHRGDEFNFESPEQAKEFLETEYAWSEQAKWMTRIVRVEMDVRKTVE